MCRYLSPENGDDEHLKLTTLIFKLSADIISSNCPFGKQLDEFLKLSWPIEVFKWSKPFNYNEFFTVSIGALMFGFYDFSMVTTCYGGNE